MNEDNDVIRLRPPDASDDPRTALRRAGARRLPVLYRRGVSTGDVQEALSARWARAPRTGCRR